MTTFFFQILKEFGELQTEGIDSNERSEMSVIVVLY